MRGSDRACRSRSAAANHGAIQGEQKSLVPLLPVVDSGSDESSYPCIGRDVAASDRCAH